VLEHRALNTIGSTRTNWLNARHHFALGAYGNPAHKPVDALYVLNDDDIAPRNGFPMHPHRNVEIVTYVREGAITHEDSEGNRGQTLAGDVQVMSAGAGIFHSERNEGENATKLFQIWIAPRETSGKPAWGTRPFPKADRAGRFVPLASGLGRPYSLPIRANAEVLGAMFIEGTIHALELPKGSNGYLVAAKGTILVNNIHVHPLEGVAIRSEPSIRIEAIEDAEVVLVVTGIARLEATP
jgi:redox-sensitive bicupin YhaK (pirin superfamily)